MIFSDKKWVLLKKEFVVEFRGGHTLYSLILYLVGSTFICYLSLGDNAINAHIWGALFWIVLFFTSLSAVSKSFFEETTRTELYLYNLANPSDIIISKIAYNALLCIFLGLLGYLFFSVFLQNPIRNQSIFILLITLVAIGFSSSLTLLAYISSATSSSFILMPILSFPIISSILLLATEITKNCINGFGWPASLDEIIVLFSVNSILASASYILFPYIWRG